MKIWVLEQNSSLPGESMITLFKDEKKAKDTFIKQYMEDVDDYNDDTEDNLAIEYSLEEALEHNEYYIDSDICFSVRLSCREVEE